MNFASMARFPRLCQRTTHENELDENITTNTNDLILYRCENLFRRMGIP